MKNAKRLLCSASIATLLVTGLGAVTGSTHHASACSGEVRVAHVDENAGGGSNGDLFFNQCARQVKIVVNGPAFSDVSGWLWERQAGGGTNFFTTGIIQESWPTSPTITHGAGCGFYYRLELHSNNLGRSVGSTPEYQFNC